MAGGGFSSVRCFHCSVKTPLCCSMLLPYLPSLPNLIASSHVKPWDSYQVPFTSLKTCATPWNQSFTCVSQILLPHLAFFFFHFSFVSPFYVRPVPRTQPAAGAIGSAAGSSVAVPWCLTGSLLKALANYSSRCHCIASLLSALNPGSV